MFEKRLARFLAIGGLVAAMSSLAFAQNASGMVSKYKSIMSSLNSRNIVNMMKNYHLGFYNQGFTYDDAAGTYGIVFGQRYYKITMSNFRMTYSELSLPYGYIEGLVRVKETESNTVLSDEDWEIGAIFVWESGKWWAYGDQESAFNRAIRQPKDEWKDIALPQRRPRAVSLLELIQ